MSSRSAEATAHSNIALAKYWGKADLVENLPAVPSISLTVDRFKTTTVVCFNSRLRKDRFTLNDTLQAGRSSQRVATLLDEVRALSGETRFADAESTNNFPTASGLASSASGFAALAGAALGAATEHFSLRTVSVLARRASASAARSVYGGFVELPSPNSAKRIDAKALYPPSYWDVALVAALTTDKHKDIGSTEGMESSRKTSPAYAAWVQEAPRLCRKIKRGLRERDLARVGETMEQSTMFFHAVAMTAQPPILYWNAATIDALHGVAALRKSGVAAYATMDAGPHVKVLCAAVDAKKVAAKLRRIEGVQRTLILRPGPGIDVRRH